MLHPFVGVSLVYLTERIGSKSFHDIHRHLLIPIHKRTLEVYLLVGTC